MTPISPLALGPDGDLACGDGPELLVYRGSGLSPAWKQFTSGMLIGVAMAPGEVISLDTEGQLCRWRARDGVALSGAQALPEAVGLAVGPDGTLVVWGRDRVWIHDGSDGAPRTWPTPGLLCAALGSDGITLGIGTSDGFVGIDLATGAVGDLVPLSEPAVAVVARAEGTWLVAAGPQVATVRSDGGGVASIWIAPDRVSALACSADGLVSAAAVPAGVVVVDHVDGVVAGTVNVRRGVGALAFGGDLRLAIGFDDADASVVDLLGGTQARTEPHPGRGRNTWRLDVGVDPAILRGARARHGAGESPIARYVPPPADEVGSVGGRGCLGGCAAIGTLMFVLSMTCGGLIGGIYLLRATGLWELIPIR